ncbi:MAG: C25 family cysteine peptidase [bacterium]|nr:C25 family cysteine peptidase [bacterium]
MKANHRSIHPVLVLVLLSLFVVASNAFAIRDWTPDDDAITGIPTGEDVPFSTEVLGIGHLRIKFDEPTIKIDQVLADKREWSFITIEGETRLWTSGDPILPQVSRAIRLPNKGNVELKILKAEYKELPNSLPVLPQQSTDLADYDGSTPKQFLMNSTTYNTDGWYPSETVRLSEPAIMRDARIALLGFQPVQYNPVTQTIRICTSLEVEIVPIGGNGENEITLPPRPVPSFAAFYRDIIGAQDLELDAISAPPGKIMMIYFSNATTLSTIQPFADWKTAAGHPVVLQSVTTGATYSSILALIQSAYTSYDPPLETVLLVGDGGTAGTYALPAQSNSDHYYAQLAGSDILADAWVGRLSVTDISQLQTVVNRTLNYERTPLMTDTTWFRHGWGYAGISHSVYSNRAAIRFMMSAMNQRGVPNVDYDEHNGSVNTSTINTRLSPGAVFWAHRPAWIGEISSSSLSGITNTNKCFVSINITCSSGEWYGSTTTGVHEGLIRLGSASAPRGGITGFSTQTASTHPPFNNVLATGAYYGMGFLGNDIPGAMYYQGKYQLWRNFQFGESGSVSNFSYWCNAMGDISANFWTGVPRYITADVPQTLGIGNNQLSLSVNLPGNVPAANALVTVWKKNASGVDETYARGVTDDRGAVSLALTNATAGNLFVTVTGNGPEVNYYPIVDTVVISTQQNDLGLGTPIIDDDNNGGTIGNSSAVANPGETVDVMLPLQNYGNSTATSITGIIQCSDPRVIISNANTSWANIASRTSQNSSTPVRVQLLAGLKDNDVVPMVLNLTYTGGTRTLTYNMTVRSMKIAFQSYTPSSTLNPGTSVLLTTTVRNTGVWAPSTTSTATLISSTPLITVNTPTVNFASLPIGSNVSNATDQRWTITTSGNILRGTQIPMSVVFTNGAVLDTMIFSVTVGTRVTTDPTGPDSYGYLCYDNTDVGYNQAPTYSWVEIISNGLGTRLTINDAGETQDANQRIRLPFAARHYGVSYDSLTICSNGWAAFGNHPYFDNFRAWHLPANEGPPNILAAFWMDLKMSSAPQGVYYYNDVANHRIVLTWNVQTLWTSATNLFQIIIFDPSFYSTPTGDAPIKFQYSTFNNATGDPSGDVDYACIGIADSTYTRGLEYSYWNQYTSGSASITAGANSNRALYFTTTQLDTNLRVVAPNGGDSLAIGAATTISWQGAPSATSVNIDLNRTYPTGTWERILTNTTNDGSENWVVTGTSSTASARIRILPTSGTGGDTSNAIFYIGFPRIVVTYPNGGETIAGSLPISVTWNKSLNSGTVMVQLNRSYPSENWETLVSNTTNDGIESITLSPPPTQTARIRVMSELIATIGDTSNSNFTLQTPAFLNMINPLTNIVSPGDSIRTTVTLQNTGSADYTGTLSANTGSGSISGWQQTSDPGGPAYRWIDASTGVAGPSGDDATTGPFTLPFTFSYYGQNYNQVWMCTNGWITFNSTTSAVYHRTTYTMPTDSLLSALAPYWSDLVVGSNGNTGNTRVLMDAANNRAVFAWNQVSRYNSATTSVLTFQVVLEADGNFYYNYQQVTGADVNVNVGLQNETRTSFINCYNNTTVPDTNTIRFTYSTRWAIPSVTAVSIPGSSSTSYSVLWNAMDRTAGDSLVGSFTFTGNSTNSPYVLPVIMQVGNPNPTIVVRQGETVIPNVTGTVSFDSLWPGEASSLQFSVENEGLGALLLTGTPAVSVTGDFACTAQPMTTIASGTAVPMTLRFTPTSFGALSGTVTISSNDSENNPYTFTVTGYGWQPPTPPENLQIMYPRLSWNASLGRVAGYGIYRDIFPYFQIDTVGYTNIVDFVSNGATTWYDSTASTNTYYYYRVNAVSPFMVASNPTLARLAGVPYQPAIGIQSTTPDATSMQVRSAQKHRRVHRFTPITGPDFIEISAKK